ncbi:hypothetical protein GCM10009868_19520 [Terrabacter aerolatus]|uniref:Uncharacterized protein n=1 Tax=Terrabacter aerolatus TaxID=422442 RepID=A0A512D023_9MICO|nr:hypothetical protein [Terrabacter aerolatus]GEO29823.1 hypothetical protein TAE01_16330 [Terrabacter aerolatus]
MPDVVKANQVLVDFLEANVVQQPDPHQPAPAGFDATTVGNPSFDSLQDLIGKLTAAGIGLDDLARDPTTSKLVFRMTMVRTAPAAGVVMDAGSARTSWPSATCAATGLTLDDGTQPWLANQSTGMRVMAGTSAGEIASNTTTSLTLSGPRTATRPKAASTTCVDTRRRCRRGSSSWRGPRAPDVPAPT